MTPAAPKASPYYVDPYTDTVRDEADVEEYEAAGDVSLCADFGLDGPELVMICQDEELYPDEQVRAIAEAACFRQRMGGDPQADWVDLNKVAIPQADEQQRLLANLIGHMNRDRKPLPGGIGGTEAELADTGRHRAHDRMPQVFLFRLQAAAARHVSRPRRKGRPARSAEGRPDGPSP